MKVSWVPPNPLIVIRDSAEKKAELMPEYIRWKPPGGPSLLLPIMPVKKTLVTGDYALDTMQDIAAVEKKGCTSEVWACVKGDRHRNFREQLRRLSEMPRAALLFTMSPGGFESPSSYIKKPKELMDGLLRMLPPNLPLFFLPHGRNPTRVGEFIVRWLLNALYTHYSKGA